MIQQDAFEGNYVRVYNITHVARNGPRNAVRTASCGRSVLENAKQIGQICFFPLLPSVKPSAHQEFLPPRKSSLNLLSLTHPRSKS